jgi:hypothetical protein
MLGNTVLSDSTGSRLYTRVGPSLSRDHFVCFGRDDTENDLEILSHKFMLLLLYIPLRNFTCSMSDLRAVVHFIFLEKVVT